MKTLRRLASVTVLTFMLTHSVLAGDMETGFSQPQPIGQAFLNILQSVIGLF